MLEVRENLFLSDHGVSDADLRKREINRVVVVSEVVDLLEIDSATVFYLPLKGNRQNPSHLKDLACHVPKYMCQNGDKVLLVDTEEGFGPAAYIAARLVCELEGKAIYDIFMEIKEKSPEFDIGQAYY